MKKIISTLIVLFLLSSKGQSQNTAPHVYIYENKTSILKDSILKMAKLNISDSSYSITSFTYVITGKRTDGKFNPTFGVNKGQTFSSELLNELHNYQSNQSTLCITDIVIHHPKKNSGNRKKINQHLNINIK